MIEDLPTRGLLRDGVLCLWGSGYRAALFHVGALTRLNEVGLLAGVETIGASGGGSIVAALLATRVSWPLEGAFRGWSESVAEPMRAIASRNARVRALLRGGVSGDALEERYARELIDAGGGDSPDAPRLVLGGAGLALAGLADPDSVEDGFGWRLDDGCPHGYEATLGADVVASVRDGLGAFGEAEQAVLENHGYLLADASVRTVDPQRLATVEPLPPDPPHPGWKNAGRVHEALSSTPNGGRFERLRWRRGARPSHAKDLWDDEAGALLERHRPIVQYDSLESYRADSAASITDLAMGKRCNTLRRADGTPVAAALPTGPGTARLNLDFLGPSAYADGAAVRLGDYLEASGGTHAADARAMRRRQGCADVVYGRAVEDSEGRRWLQYFFFYYYNDKGMLSVGMHEGDWEMVQLSIGDDGSPEAVTFAQHAGAERAAWSEVERRGGGDAPVVYCARGSHAPLPRAGTHWAPIVPDHNDGSGPAVRPRLVRIGQREPGWVMWPGRWGSTRRREAFEGSSPFGPARLRQWWHPDRFHREARPMEETRPWREAEPPAPALTVRRDDTGATVEYRFPLADARTPPARILAGPYNSVTAEPPSTQVFGIETRSGSFVLRLPAGGQADRIHLSVVSKRGAPGATLTVPCED